MLFSVISVHVLLFTVGTKHEFIARSISPDLNTAERIRFCLGHFTYVPSCMLIIRFGVITLVQLFCPREVCVINKKFVIEVNLKR